MRKITEDEFKDAEGYMIGWCTHCEEFTRECTESDAEEYDCDECEQLTVYGAEQALLLGLIAILGD